MKLSGSKIIVESLLHQGVETVFGYPGGAIMPLYDALYDAPIRHILTVHEQGAAHAADGYARSSGRVGVCIATSGPGATNLVTGLATAYLDSSPVVAITGQVSTSLLGRDSFQELDITGITMPITKHNFLVKNVNSLADTINRAFMIAVTGRPGPVLVDVPRDVLVAMADYHPEKSAATVIEEEEDFSAAQSAISAAQALMGAKQPVMVIGGGVKVGAAFSEVLALAEFVNLPVVSTLMGLGAFAPEHPNFLGLTGMHGHRAANLAVHQADVVLAVGTRFSDRVTGDASKYSSGRTIIHLDVDAAEIGKNVAAEITIMGDLRRSITSILGLLQQSVPNNLTTWWRKISAWRRDKEESGNVEVLTPPWMMRYMSEATQGKPVTWVTDVGQHQMWAAQHLKVHDPRSWLTSGGLGTMGFGMPAAVGAQAACPDRRVILIAGDGGFKMTGLELYTTVNENLPVVCVVINNRSLGMVRQWQKLFFAERYSSTNLAPFDFAGFVRSCGAEARLAQTSDEFRTAFQQALSSMKPSVIIADIHPDYLVSPMVHPGQSIDQFVE